MALTSHGLNLAGVRKVLELQEETQRLQAELTRLKTAARDGTSERNDGDVGLAAALLRPACRTHLASSLTSPADARRARHLPQPSGPSDAGRARD